MRRAKNPLVTLERYVDKHKNKSEAAKALGISLPYLSDLLRGRRDFSDDMLARIGLRRESHIVSANE